ncbi:acyl-CoA carboxylase epsilon subunit [Actinomadura terrae]|uniref:acyl-CoA carboxylase epsilon subunit n=1 Tax=Actinomadura terrae TaxID=604353 RepID=UPI001FA72D67|nr:acyl-CoA carboxylase epsilon subunit [Actinomadura terrae]
MAVRIDKGRLTEEELAAVIAVLMARPARATVPAERRRARARWQRRDHRVALVHPRSWQAVGPA